MRIAFQRLMDTIFTRLKARDAESGLVNVVIDTPRGSRNKYKYDEENGCFRLSRILPMGHSFPYDFGSIPGTRAADGDALDVLVVMDDPAFPGCVLGVKLIGVLAARQSEKGRSIRNDRLLAVPQTSVNKPRIRELRELGTEQLRQIERFFASYNEAQGRRFEVIGRFGSAKAEKLLERAISEYSSEAD
jgi:inorganic pyrophosphatase